MTRTDALILPASLHDGDDFPDGVQAIHWLPLNKYDNVRLNPHGQTAEEFASLVDGWTRTIAAAVENAPEVCDPKWIDLRIDDVLALFKAAPARQTQVPAFGRE